MIVMHFIKYIGGFMKRLVIAAVELIIIIVICIYFSDIWMSLLLSIIFILLHESGHLLAAKFLGYSFDRKSLQILPFGMRLGFKEKFIVPSKDIVISIAGPMVNLLFFLMFYFAGILKQNDTYIYIADINVALFLFNMLPAVFLDGGRVFKAIIAYYISYYYSCLLVNINGIIIGVSFILYFIYKGISLVGIPLFMLGIFFIFEGTKSIKKNVFISLSYILNKNYVLDINKNLKIKLLCYSKNTKLLDIIKNFCFNKYYVIYVIEDGNLRYNMNEADLIRLFYEYGNIKLEDCVNYTKAQEVKDG
jgi:stage IV sporulation protein FB